MAVPGLVFRYSSSMEEFASDSTVNIAVPNTGAGNCLVLFFQSATNASPPPSVTDNQGNIWAAAVTTTGNQSMSCMVATNVAAGTNQITLALFASATFLQFEYSEWFNISTAALATALDGTGSAVLVSGSTVATSPFTTTQDGDLILHWVTNDGGTNNTSFTKGSGFTLLTANVNPQIAPSAVQYQVQATHGSITPTMTLGGGAPTCDTLAIALKSASAGTPPPAGMRLAGVQKCGVGPSTTSVALQFPHIGNLICLVTTHDHPIATLTDGDGNAWDHSHSFTALSQPINSASFAANVAPNTDMLGPTVTYTGASPGVFEGFATLYDIVGADPNPFAQFATASGTQSVTANLDTVRITPLNQNSVIVVDVLVTSHTVSALAAPTPANGGCGLLAAVPSANGAGTSFEDDDFHGVWQNGSLTAAQLFTLAIQNNAAPNGVGDWSGFAIEFKAAATGPAGIPVWPYRN